MGLKKDLSTLLGINAGHWEITGYTYNCSDGSCTITVSGWNKKQDFNNAYQPLVSKSYTTPAGTNYTNQADMFTYLQSISDFNGATSE